MIYFEKGYRFSQYPVCKFVDSAEETTKLEYNYVILEFCLNWNKRLKSIFP